MKMICFDTEVFKHDWLFCATDLNTGEEFVIWNDREAFSDFYTEYRDGLWIGYNVNHYDQYIVKGLLCGLNPYKISHHIIVEEKPGWTFSSAFRTVRLNFYDVMVKNTSLKKLELFMGMDIEESPVDFHIDRPLTDDERELTVKYCKHDVKSTCEVLNKTMSRFSSQVSIIKTFKRPLRDMCKTQAQLAGKVLGAVKTNFNDKYDLRIPETLTLNKYGKVIDWYLNAKLDTVEEMKLAGKNPSNPFEFEVFYDERYLILDVAGVPTKFGWGGLHGAIPQFHHTCQDDEVMYVIDVDQLYPSLMVNYNLLSRTVREPEKYVDILATSLRLKAEGKKTEREPYKLLCNTVYGVEGQKDGVMYDPLHRNLVCVYGQLLMLDLIEKIENSCKIVQANTDGVLVLVKKDNVDKLKEIVNDWERRTHLNMSYSEYHSIYQKDVNNYIAIKKDKTYKLVGDYVKKLSPIDYDLPIVRKAVIEYFVNGVHPRDTITACDDLIEFQKCYTVSKKFSHAVWCGKKLKGKVFRVFASTNKNLTHLGRTKGEGMTVVKFGLCPKHAFIWNKSVIGVKVPDDLDKEFYIDLALKRLAAFGFEVTE